MLSGRGAKRFGGRWNSKGVPAAYCAETLSLAALEILAHLPRGSLKQYVYLEVEIPDDQIVDLAWDRSINSDDQQLAGDGLLGPAGVLAFRVPSLMNPIERNVIVNPEHVDFELISHGEIQPFPVDPRLTSR